HANLSPSNERGELLTHHIAQLVARVNANTQDIQQRAVAEDIGLGDKTSAVMLAAKLRLPCQLIQLGSAPEPGDIVFTQLGCCPIRKPLQSLGDIRGEIHVDWVQLAIFPGTKLCHVVRSAGLRGWTHHGLLPAAERLALHDGDGDTAGDIGVADLDIFDPVTQLGIVQRMNAAGQAVARGVLPFDGIFQGLGVHDAQDWAEALVEVVPGTRLYVIANTRGPQGAFLIELFWLNQPLLAGIQLGQTAQQFIARWLNEAVHRGFYFKAGADFEGTYGIEKLIAQAIRFAGCTDEDD